MPLATTGISTDCHVSKGAISKVINRNLVMFLFAMTFVHLASHVWQRRNICACQDHGR